MFRKILVAVDGSEASQRAVDWAVQAYNELPNASFTIMYVNQPVPVTTPEAGMYVPEEALQMPEHTAAEDACQRFRSQERVTYRNVTGYPSDAVCDEARAGGYDVIVLGSEGHGAVSSVLLGSVSAKVLHRAPCSVLVIR